MHIIRLIESRSKSSSFLLPNLHHNFTKSVANFRTYQDHHLDVRLFSSFVFHASIFFWEAFSHVQGIWWKLPGNWFCPSCFKKWKISRTLGMSVSWGFRNGKHIRLAVVITIHSLHWRYFFTLKLWYKPCRESRKMARCPNFAVT